ncbi:MAG: hypothetical protein OXI53_05920 [Nitrospira sp.]|nr:hypothetical protein [Nitrospira sp.]MDE0404830.1 hypothetical protein [Nitrospira sp.]MDE0485357.1 hypothetical protein [Nitrospira sp.]
MDKPFFNPTDFSKYHVRIFLAKSRMVPQNVFWPLASEPLIHAGGGGLAKAGYSGIP